MCCLLQILNLLNGFYRILYEHCAIRGHVSALFFNFPQHLMITCRTRELFEVEGTLGPEQFGSFDQVCFVL